MGWGVSFCQQQASQLGCVVLTLHEGGTCNVFSTPHYTGCSVRVLAFTQGSSQTCSLLIPKKDSWQVAQHTEVRSENGETGQLISLNRVMVRN